MFRRKKLLLMVLLAAVVGGTAVYLARPDEPVVEGKTLTEWLLVGIVHPPSGNSGPLPEKLRHADEVVASLGTNAVPTIIRLLEKRDSRTKISFMKICQKQSLVQFSFIRDRQYHDAALRGLITLNVHGTPFFPALRDGLQKIGTNRNETTAVLWEWNEALREREAYRLREANPTR